MHRAGPCAILLFAFLFLCPACGARRLYPGPERPREEVVRLRPGTGSMDHRLSILEVDGREIAIDAGELEVLPGRHTVLVRLTHEPRDAQWLQQDPLERSSARYSNPARVTLEFESNPGRTYVVYGTIVDENQPVAWITDRETKKVIVEVRGAAAK
ncbi:MAG: hypothetical protein V3T86_02105 [Planctomycetota bacterium]